MKICLDLKKVVFALVVYFKSHIVSVGVDFGTLGFGVSRRQAVRKQANGSANKVGSDALKSSLFLLSSADKIL